MALYKLLSYSSSTCFCHKCLLPVLKEKSIPIKKLNWIPQKNFMTTIKRGSRIKYKNTKAYENTKLKNVENQPVSKNSLSLLVKPFMFTVGTCGLSVVVTAIWQYENVRNRAFQMLKKNWIKDKIYIFERKKYTWRQEFNKKWNQLSQGQKLFVPICFLNVLVFLSWQIKRFQPGMMKYFCSSPFGVATCLPMLLATFSHCNILHLAANMYVLHTFTTGAVQDLGKEQFVALYLSSAVVSSFASYLYKVVRSQTGPSLGASGAVMGMIAYICSKYPDSTLSIIGLPSISFSADTGIKCIILLDIIGLLKGWKFMDHAAHLGGSFCGIAWCQWGNAYIWKKKEPLLEWWHELRTPK